MDMTYSESQTPLFSPSYLNLVFEKHPWKIGESPHNTDCDATVGIINMYASKNLHMPAHAQCQAELRSRIIGSSAGEETSEDHRENGRSIYNLSIIGYRYSLIRSCSFALPISPRTVFLTWNNIKQPGFSRRLERTKGAISTNVIFPQAVRSDFINDNLHCVI